VKRELVETERVYYAIITSGTVSLPDLAVELDVTEDAIERTVHRLLDTGMIRRSATIPDAFYSAGPVVALLRGIESFIERQNSDLNLLATAAQELKHKSNSFISSNSQLNLLHRKDDILKAIGECETSARYRIDGIVPGTQSIEELRRAYIDDLPTLKRGIRCRTLVPEESRKIYNQKKYRYLIDHITTAGMQIRTSEYTPVRLLLFDDDTAIISETRCGDEAYAIVTTSHHLVDALSRIFDNAWDYGRPLSGPPDASQPSALQLRILEALTHGATDSRIAKNLNTNCRRIEREISDLRKIISAANRAELAAEAIRRGWVA